MQNLDRDLTANDHVGSEKKGQALAERPGMNLGDRDGHPPVIDKRTEESGTCED